MVVAAAAETAAAAAAAVMDTSKMTSQFGKCVKIPF